MLLALALMVAAPPGEDWTLLSIEGSDAQAGYLIDNASITGTGIRTATTRIVGRSFMGASTWEFDCAGGKARSTGALLDVQGRVTAIKPDKWRRVKPGTQVMVYLRYVCSNGAERPEGAIAFGTGNPDERVRERLR